MICDFLYLRHDYNTLAMMQERRIDEERLKHLIDREKLTVYAQRFDSKAFQKRIDLFISYYKL